MYKIKLYAKHNDLFNTTVLEDGNVIYDKDDYSPGDENLSVCSSCDELEFEIDVETGKIIGWDKEKALNYIERIKTNTLDDDYVDDDDDVDDIQERWDKRFPEIEKRRDEDNQFYMEKFKETKQQIQSYKDKFGGIELEDDGESVYTTSISRHDSPAFAGYRLMSISMMLMDNDIFVKLDGNTLKVNKVDSDKARNLLRENGVYKYRYLRRKDDADSIKW